MNDNPMVKVLRQPQLLQELTRSFAVLEEGLTARPRMKRARRARRPTLSAALKQARKAGAKVSGAVLDPSGAIELRFGEQGTDDMPNGNANPWDEVLSHAADQKRPS